MCELFGINSRNKLVINDYLRTFYSHSEVHNYGWGLACFYGGAASVEKEPVKAIESQYLRQRLQHPIAIDNALAHIRLATVGNMSYENCHPFVRRDNQNRCWTLVHNGTIFDFPMLDKYRDFQEGKTDSERILFYIIDSINAAQEKMKKPLDFQERFNLLDNLIADLSHKNKINLLFWDGEYMYVHCNFANTLYVSNLAEETKIFSTQPLNTDGTWEEVEFRRLLAYKNGELVQRGTHLSEEYFKDEKESDYKYFDYSYL